MTAPLKRIIAVRLVTQNPDALARFYAEALGAEVGRPSPIPPSEAALFGAGERRALKLGRGRIDLDVFQASGAAYPDDVGADDLRFQHMALAADDIAAVLARALQHGARLISRGGAIRLPPSSGGVTAVKLRDPEGHPFELIAFPAGGPWDKAAPNGHGVRGLDHSAIVVRDAEASRRFYAERGLTAQGATVNRGPTQAALDALDAPVVEVVPLVPAEQTPHLELLGYHGERPPAPAVADRDVAATRIVWAGEGEPLLLHDPDGHRHLLSGG